MILERCLSYQRRLAQSREFTSTIDVLPGLFGSLSRLAHEFDNACDRMAVVVDQGLANAQPAVKEAIISLVDAHPGSAVTYIRGGEADKSMATLERLLQWFDAQQVRRRSHVVAAVGGGAVLDTVSLAASLYRRGVRLWRLPSTFLAATDAGIGAKTAVNFRGRKNLVGTYYPPERVLVDPSVLHTLPRRQVRSGLAEAIKLGIAADAHLFEMLERDVERVVSGRAASDVMEGLVRRCITSMLDELSADLFERELVHVTDLGHSFSRQIEQEVRPRLLHGEAVSIDIAFSTACAVNFGYAEEEQAHRILQLLERAGLPTANRHVDDDVLVRGYEDILTHRDSDVFPFPVSPGRTRLDRMSRTNLAAALEARTRS